MATNLIILVLGAYTAFRRPEHPAARALLLFGAGLTAYTIFGVAGCLDCCCVCLAIVGFDRVHLEGARQRP